MYKITNVTLETVCGYTSKLPATQRPEIAFAGRSNVGKSSLINSLVQRKALARTSSQPGKTATVNYYHVNKGETRGGDFAPDVYLVDLPGYGYAHRSKEEKVKWGELIERYLHASKSLDVVFLLVDMRHDPTEDDALMYRWILSSGKKPVIIATKKDKVKKSEQMARLDQVRTVLRVSHEDPVIPFSAVTKEGTLEIWDTIIHSI
ncbi:MAG: ribosome biogenesis GTP-binding protein YihA/YsxC [Lachnospiraceae bacterium]|nr:ribosome biogenesis GTP-binding protein YihA/YsxC [Lachnospiraceae bacterium]